ncbi:ANTAR domain-containing protein [Blastococcus goldschmidtiae]|uniref:ANTAR domain-containing protein n=1 Tax=Blastococcus goldschmidtiae TaxID=3075546 RepID=A0ABU2KBS4_9ACTN|nr:ANTAR domain-containing protein [Blastococcus sp. DSM 46792]MDT0277644.1 ANTAR domain-containing protein [Blastococcus sp. DSM 46792]
MIPGPRPSDGQSRPLSGPGDPVHRALDRDPAPVALTRTPRGWVVRSDTGSHAVGDVVEGMSLADLIAEEFGSLPEPDRSTRRSARGAVVAAGATPPVVDEAALRIAALERIVSQLEHALAARVSTERAIGVLAERHGLSVRAAFETLRRDARSQGRPVAELARALLDGLPQDAPPAPPVAAGPAVPVAAADGRS